MKAIRHLAVLALGIVLLSACGSVGPGRTPNVTPRPSPRVTVTPGATSKTPTPAADPSSVPWTADWQDGFCTTFADIVIAQQLARDIGRSLAADDRDNAIGLAHELQTTVTDVGTAIAGLPTWPGSTDVVTAVTTLLQQDASLASQYLRYLEDGRSAGLDRAHEAEATLRETAIPAVTATVGSLVGKGLTCPDTALVLESP